MPARFAASIEQLFHMNATDAATLATDLYQRSVRGYNRSLNAQLEALGHAPTFRLQNKAELQRLRAQAVEVARGIAETYNENLAAQVDRIVESEGRRGLNRRTLARRLADWDRERAKWKTEQIQRTESARIATQATQAFAANSRLDARFVLVPAASTDDDANDQAARSGRLLEADDPALTEIPAHPGERHSAVLALGAGETLDAAWLGG